MNLNYIRVVNNYNAVADRFKKSPEFKRVFFLCVLCFFYKKFRAVAEFDIIYGKGISQEGCLIDLGVEFGVLKKSGAWFSYKDDKVAQGREKMRDYLVNNPDVKAEIEAAIREEYKLIQEKKA